MGRRLAALVGLAMLAGAVLVSAPASVKRTSSTAAESAKIVFVDVGQGDAVVMKIGGKIVISDAGQFNANAVDDVLKDLGAKQIDVAILSHPHDDHVDNFIDLIRGFDWSIELAVLSESAWWQGTETNRDLIDLLREEGVPRRITRLGDRFEWGGAEWIVLNPPGGEFTGGAAQSANASVSYLLRVNGVEALFTGDVEPKVGRRIALAVDQLLDDPLSIFLATHHGSKHGSIEELLDVAQPRWAVISAGKGNQFKHPAPEAIERLQAAGASIWCTDTNGNITARISAAGRLTWRASRQPAPWWSARDQKQTDTCVGR